MDYDDFSRQLETMSRRFLQLCPINGSERRDLCEMWEETSAALGVSVEELRVADEEMRSQNQELEESRRVVETECRRYQELFDFAPDAYLVTDLYGAIREANRAAGDLLGISPRYLVGKPLANWVMMEDRLGFRRGLARLAGVGRRAGWRVVLTPRKGGPFAASMTAAVVRESDGTSAAIRWMIREGDAEGVGGHGRVTVGRPEAAEESAQSDEIEALRGLISGLDLIVWEADAETGRCWYISPRAEKVLGYPPECWTDVPGFWGEIIHVDDRTTAVATRARLLREGKGGELEYRIIAADERVVWFRESLTVEVDGSGRPTVARGCLWDISRRKKVERQLYTDRRRLSECLSDAWHMSLLAGRLLATLETRPLLEEILSAVASLVGAEMGAACLLDPDGDEPGTVAGLGMSPAYLERFGRPPSSRPEPAIVEDAMAEGPGAAEWAEAAGLGGFRGVYCVPIIGREGAAIAAVACFFREPHRPGDRQMNLVGQYVLQAADALENARRYHESREAIRRKEQFLATLAHELRNPLAAIQTIAHLLRPDALDAETIGEVRGVIDRQVGQMARLVEDVIDVSRLSRGPIRLKREPVDLGELIDGAAEDVRPLMEIRGHELWVKLPPEPIRLEVDPSRMVQVIANLLTNAAKYTDSGGRIEVVADREGDEAVIRVRDNGIGLSAESLPGLFRPYIQVDAAHDRSRGGLGIGLALVKSLVELHGGSVRASSDGPGHGSEFAVRLPL